MKSLGTAASCVSLWVYTNNCSSDDGKRKTKMLRKRLVPSPLCPPQILHKLLLVLNTDLCREKLVTDCPRCGVSEAFYKKQKAATCIQHQRVMKIVSWQW